MGFVTNSSRLLKAVQSEIEKQLETLSRSSYIRKSLEKAGFAVLVKSIKEAIAICNDLYSPALRSLRGVCKVSQCALLCCATSLTLSVGVPLRRSEN